MSSNSDTPPNPNHVVVGKDKKDSPWQQLVHKIWPPDASQTHKLLVIAGGFTVVAIALTAVALLTTPNHPPDTLKLSDVMDERQNGNDTKDGASNSDGQSSDQTQTPGSSGSGSSSKTQPKKSTGGGSGGNTGSGSGSGGSGGGGSSISCALPKFPTPECTGVPSGWTPTTTHSGDLTITTPGTVIQDYLVDGDINVRADNVTIRRTKVREGGIINEYANVCHNGLVLEDVSITPAAGQSSSYAGANGVIGPGGYTATRVEIDSRVEGFRAGGDSLGCGPVVIQDSFIKLRVPPGSCGTNDWHTDGIQGYDADLATIRHVTIDYDVPCGTGPMYNASPDADGGLISDILIVGSGGFAFELNQGQWSQVTGLRIAGSWSYGKLDVTCSKIAVWRDNRSATVDSSYNITSVGGLLPNGCTESP